MGLPLNLMENTGNKNFNKVSTMHTFSAKEKDSETGLSYFGARYYSSDLSIWLSVDPQASKYPSLSPYVYCADYPVKLVDPDGEEFVDSEGNRVRVRILKDGSIQYKFSRKTSEETQSEFISNHNESFSALAKTKLGRKCIRYLNNCYTSVSISPTDESGNQNSLVIPSCDENGNVEITDGVYENVVIKPFMGTIRSKASRDNVDADEILGATLIVEAGHLKKSQILRDYDVNRTEESKYYQLYNQYVDYRYNYRKEMGQPIDGTVFNNSSNINPKLNRINSKRQKQYGQK
jgi:RHS repeat-associated protein